MMMAEELRSILRGPTDRVQRLLIDGWVIVRAVVILLVAIGIALASVSHALDHQVAWRPARFGGHVPIAFYGWVYIVGSIPMCWAAWTRHTFRPGRAASYILSSMSAFLGAMFVQGAVDSGGQGLVAALFYLFVSWLLWYLVSHRPRGG